MAAIVPPERDRVLTDPEFDEYACQVVVAVVIIATDRLCERVELFYALFGGGGRWRYCGMGE